MVFCKESYGLYQKYFLQSSCQSMTSPELNGISSLIRKSQRKYHGSFIRILLKFFSVRLIS